MIRAITDFSSEEEIRACIAQAEAGYRATLGAAARKILERGDCRVVTLSGPTCAGKTTTGKILTAALQKAGRHVTMISLDDFYLDRAVLLARAGERGGEIDFDSPDTLDYDCLSGAMAEILSGRPVHLPCFDFKAGARTGERLITPSEEDVYIIEGIQAVYPEVVDCIGDGARIGVFAMVMQEIEAEGRTFSAEEIRFFRRLVRDSLFRGADPAFTARLWQSVRKNEEKNVLPYAAGCDIRIDTTMAYELSALRPFLCPLLAALPEETPQARLAKESLPVLERVPGFDPSFLPSDSLYREFLG